MRKITGIVLLLLVLCGAVLIVALMVLPKSWPDSWTFLRTNYWYEYQGKEQVEKAIFTLAQSGEPRKLALAALLASQLNHEHMPFPIKGKAQPGSDPVVASSSIENWLKTALQSAEADDVLLFSMLSGLHQFPDIQSETLRRWQQLEIDNLVPLLYQKELSAPELLTAAGQRSRVSKQGYATQRWIYQTLKEQLPKAPEEALALKILSLGIPDIFADLRKLLTICRDPQEIADEYSEGCRHIGTVLHSQSESLILKMLGIALLKKQAAGSAELQVLDNEREHIGWLLKQRGAVSLFKTTRYALMVLQDPAINGEQQEIESILRLEGLPITESGLVAPES